MKKFSLVLAALLVGGSLFGAEEGIVIKGKVTTDSTVSGTVDVSNEGKLNVGGVTITGDKSFVGSDAEVSSITKLKDATVDGSTVNIGNIDIKDSRVEKGRVITDSQIDHIEAKGGSIANIGNVSLENSTIKNGGVESKVTSTGTIHLNNAGTLNMGNVSLQNAEVNGDKTLVKSTVTNNSKIESTGVGGSSVDLGSISIVGGKVNEGSQVTSIVTNDGTIAAKKGGAVTMGKIESYGATISGATVSSKVTVTGTGSVTATGANSQANFGGIRIGDKK